MPASGPAYASPSMLSPIYANARQDLGPGQLEASVLAGAEAYGVAARPVSTTYLKTFKNWSLDFTFKADTPSKNWFRLKNLKY